MFHRRRTISHSTPRASPLLKFFLCAWPSSLRLNVCGYPVVDGSTPRVDYTIALRQKGRPALAGPAGGGSGDFGIAMPASNRSRNAATRRPTVRHPSVGNISDVYSRRDKQTRRIVCLHPCSSGAAEPLGLRLRLPADEARMCNSSGFSHLNL